MAYSNWGAKVWCDGMAMHNNCDTTILAVLNGEENFGYLGIFAHLITTSEEERGKPLKFAHHAIVGDKDSGIIIGLRKDDICYILTNDEIMKEEVSAWSEEYEPERKVVNIGGIDVDLQSSRYPVRVECEFTDIIGRHWKAISGYGMGEGFEDWD